MTEHRISLFPHPRRLEGVLCRYEGRELGIYRHGAIYEAARYLLGANLAVPEDIISTWWGETLSMRGKVGGMAKWVVRFDSLNGDHLVRYAPFESRRPRLSED